MSSKDGGNQGEGAVLDAIEKVQGGINPQAARQQVVNLGQKDTGKSNGPRSTSTTNLTAA